jgi:hypothetical protein
MAYCSVDDVLQLLPKNITNKTNDARTANKPITEDQIQLYIDDAESILNSTLSTIYVTPLYKIIRVNRKDGTETEVFPDPVTTICSASACFLIYTKLYTENNNPGDFPKYAQEMRDLTNRHVNAILSGATILRGQRLLGKRYVRPESMDTIRLPVQFDKFDIAKMG